MGFFDDRKLPNVNGEAQLINVELHHFSKSMVVLAYNHITGYIISNFPENKLYRRGFPMEAHYMDWTFIDPATIEAK